MCDMLGETLISFDIFVQWNINFYGLFCAKATLLEKQ